MEIEPIEAENVRRFFKWLARDRLSLREIQRRATSLNFRTPRSGKGKRVTLSCWHKRSIGRILTNETYMGIAYYRKYKRPFNNLTSIIDEDMLRSKDEWIPMTVPPIISREQFETAKAQLVKNREFSKRNLKHDYLFPKLVYCGECGFKMFGGFQPGRQAEHAGSKYYHGAYRKPDEPGTTQRCKTCPQIAESRLIPIWDRLKGLLEDPTTALEQIRRQLANEYDKQAISERVGQIEKHLAALEQKRHRLGQVYSEDESMDLDGYKTMLEEIRIKEIALREEQARLSQALFDKNEVRDRAEAIKKTYAKLKMKLGGATDAQRQQIARLFVDKIRVYPRSNEAEVTFNLRPQVEIPRMAMTPNGVLLRDVRAG